MIDDDETVDHLKPLSTLGLSIPVSPPLVSPSKRPGNRGNSCIAWSSRFIITVQVDGQGSDVYIVSLAFKKRQKS